MSLALLFYLIVWNRWNNMKTKYYFYEYNSWKITLDYSKVFLDYCFRAYENL